MMQVNIVYIYLMLLLNITSMIEGRSLFDELIWRTVLKTFFLGTVFGLIQACNFFLAAQWRQQLCDRFQEIIASISQWVCIV